MTLSASSTPLVCGLASALYAASCGGQTAGSSLHPNGEFNDVTSGANWSTFDLSAVGPGLGLFHGAVFDGRYVYVSPYNRDAMLRYDTQAPFADASSWTEAAPAVLGMLPTANSATFDTRYVYFSSGSTVSPFLARYDTTAPFASDSSWTPFTTAALPGFFDGAGLGDGNGGDAFDGRFVYLAAGYNAPPATSAKIARFDTLGPFDVAASWSMFDGAMSNPAAHATFCPLFDGRYLYILDSDSTTDTTTSPGIVQRYDTQAPFDVPTSWASFSTSTILPSGAALLADTFDGRFVYVFAAGAVARFDTRGNFTASSSWSVGPIVETFGGPPDVADPTGTLSFFDGRYVSFYGPNGPIVRYDTLGTFADPAAWTKGELAALEGIDSATYGGVDTAAFDGKYLYVFGDGSLVARFDTKATASLPAETPAALF